MQGGRGLLSRSVPWSRRESGVWPRGGGRVALFPLQTLPKEKVHFLKDLDTTLPSGGVGGQQLPENREDGS